MSDAAILEAFYGLFRGNQSFFVKHQAPFYEKEGKLKAAWCGFAVYNKRTPPPEGCALGDLIPVTKEHYKEHLNGGDGLAVAPLCSTRYKRNVCFYAAIDIDVYGVDFTWLVRRLYRAGFKFAAFLSKSEGLHIYFFFVDPEPGDKVIEVLNRIVEVYGLSRLFVNEKQKSKVEVFPKQAVFVPGDTNVNCLFLPFYNSADPKQCKNKMLTVDGKTVGIKKALPIIEDTGFTSVKKIGEILDGLPYSDAPYCIQMVLLTGALAENDGRNNFLFSAAIYLKKKYKENFYEALAEMNGCLEAPLEKKDIDSIYKSVAEKGYDHYACSRPPCSDYCDKKLCRLREYGPEKERGNRLTGADCWGLIIKYTAEGSDDPYYEWQVRVSRDGEFKAVRFDNEREMQVQAVVQQKCIRYLSWSPYTVKQNDWAAILNKAMEGVRNRKEGYIVTIPRVTDTTESSMMYNAFLEYLTHKQIQKSGNPLMVKAGQVYRAEGAYYFDAEGFMDYLRLKKFNLGHINVQAKLISFGCVRAPLVYMTQKGEERKFVCWKKPETEELLSLDVLYEDIYDDSHDIIQRNPLNKGKKEEADGDGNIRF